MKTLIIAAAFALTAGAALAQSQDMPPSTTIVCVDVAGRTLPTTCTAPASRLDPREDICSCSQGERVVAPVCPKGVREPAETRAFQRARREALAGGHGSLIGATYKGQPMCVDPRRP
jgi:hypothetical protein